MSSAGFAWFLPILFLLTLTTTAQNTERKLIRDGNKMYQDKKYSDAEVSYKKSLGMNKNSIPGNYNLGNAYYKEGKFDEASQQYQSVFSNKDVSDDQKAKTLHNIGNSLMQAKKYPESIEAYKNSLKLNPKDNDTRYNLAYAQSMLQQQQQQQQQKQDKNNKDKNQDKKDQQQKDKQSKDQKDKQDQQGKDQQKQDKEDQKQAGQKKQNISKEDAEKILQALNNDEKNTQKKLIRKESTKIQIEKAW
ncbi:MAG: tetratricopeptide repeat protein [Bacteroidetes bacterium]|nr:tetratricopeptide repeat protein [Bacteroidota bacterium]